MKREEQEFNIKLVKTIEKYPELYDVNHELYGKRSATEEAWKIISKEVKVTAKDCKYRWKVLRVSLARSLRQKQNEKVDSSKKEYYLSEHMQFVIPFTKTWKLCSKCTQVHCPISAHYIICLRSNIETEYLQTVFILPMNIATTFEDEKSSEAESTLSSVEESEICSSIPSPQSVHDIQTTQVQSITQNCDVENFEIFVKSLLPHVAKMDSNQRTRFKAVILNGLNDILNTQV